MSGAAAETTATIFENKATWGDGPWQDEPDRIYWVDEKTGLPCLIRRAPSGALCGYVGITTGHPWHEIDYMLCTLSPPCSESYCEHRPDGQVDVHGGLTYAAGCDGNKETGICHVPEPDEPDEAWWFGFDCSHYQDLAPAYEARNRERGLSPLSEDQAYRDVDYVRSEVLRLAEQLAAVTA